MRAWLIALTLVTSACEDDQPVCVPDQVTSCFCETGERGTMTCRRDGERYARCACTPDAGLDAGIDAAPDAAE